MKTLVAATLTAAVLSGIAFAAPSADAAPFKRHFGKVTPYERVLINRSQANVNAIQRRIRADGRVTAWERAHLRTAQARHNMLVARLRHS